MSADRSPEPDRFCVSDRLPAVLAVGEFRCVLGLKWSRFCLLQRQGAYRHLELRSLDGVRRYSGVKVARWLNGDDTRIAIRHTRSVRPKSAA